MVITHTNKGPLNDVSFPDHKITDLRTLIDLIINSFTHDFDFEHREHLTYEVFSYN